MNTEEYETMFGVENRHWWYVGLRQMIARAWRRHVFGDVSALRVLDVGCGTGANLETVWAGEAAGIDISPEAISFCRRRGLVKTAIASALALPFDANCFDAVLSTDVLEHEFIADKRGALMEMGRVLNPGGLLFVNVPAYQWLLSSHDAATRQDRRFSRGELARLLRSADFDPIDMTYWNTILFPVAAAVRIWRKKHPPEGSDLANPTGWLANGICGSLLNLERMLLKAGPLPYGLSLFAVARRT